MREREAAATAKASNSLYSLGHSSTIVYFVFTASNALEPMLYRTWIYFPCFFNFVSA